MSEELFALDRTRLHLVIGADPTGQVGGLDTPEQASRVAFLAAEVGAITWNDDRWPELEFGVWCEPEQQSPRRRRSLAVATSTELNIWLQLRSAWPQLGGPSIQWPLPDTFAGGPDGDGTAGRLAAVAAATVEALNATYRRALRMAEALVQTSSTNESATNGFHTATASQFHTANPTGSPFHTAMPTASPNGRHAEAQAPVATAVATEPTTIPGMAQPARTYSGTAIAASEHEIGKVLATLVHDAEADAMRYRNGLPTAVVALSHAVTALPDYQTPAVGFSGRFLVSVTAVIETRHR